MGEIHPINFGKFPVLIMAVMVLVWLSAFIPPTTVDAGQPSGSPRAATTHRLYLPQVVTLPGNNIAPLVDGNFEHSSSGNAKWIEYRSYANRPLIVQTAGDLNVAPRSGNWFAWLGGDHLLGETVNHQSRIASAAPVPLPNQTPIYLNFYYQVISEEVPDAEGLCVDDVINIWVNNILMYQGQLCNLSNTNGWMPFSIDVSLFAGQNVTLEFEIRSNYQRFSHVMLDDIAFQSVRLTANTPSPSGRFSGQPAMYALPISSTQNIVVSTSDFSRTD